MLLKNYIKTYISKIINIFKFFKNLRIVKKEKKT